MIKDAVRILGKNKYLAFTRMVLVEFMTVMDINAYGHEREDHDPSLYIQLKPESILAIINKSEKNNKNNFFRTFGEGTTEKVFMILSGYSSRTLEIRRVPIPDPVPPPNE